MGHGKNIVQGFCQVKKNPKSVFFVFFVLFSCFKMFPIFFKKMDNGVAGWGLTNPRFLDFF